MVLLDTDIMIDILRQYLPAVAWLRSIGEEKIVLPGFVVMELIQGCKNKTEQEKVEKNLEGYLVTWPSQQACDEALSIFARYFLSHGIGILDALVGQLAVTIGLPLHTFNKKHYAAVPKLKTIQPYTKESQPK